MAVVPSPHSFALHAASHVPLCASQWMVSRVCAIAIEGAICGSPILLRCGPSSATPIICDSRHPQPQTGCLIAEHPISEVPMTRVPANLRRLVVSQCRWVTFGLVASRRSSVLLCHPTMPMPTAGGALTAAKAKDRNVPRSRLRTSTASSCASHRSDSECRGSDETFIAVIQTSETTSRLGARGPLFLQSCLHVNKRKPPMEMDKRL